MYKVEIYDFQELCEQYPNIGDSLTKLASDKDWQFVQCLQLDENSYLDVTYENIHNDEETTTFSFDPNTFYVIEINTDEG